MAVGGAALGELPAVAVRDVVEDQQRFPVGLLGRLREALRLGLRIVRTDPLADGLPRDLLDQTGVLPVAVLRVSGDLPGRVPVRVDPVRVAAPGSLTDGTGTLARAARTGGRAGRARTAGAGRGGTSREQQNGPGHGHRTRSPHARPAVVTAVHPLPLGCDGGALPRPLHPGTGLLSVHPEAESDRLPTVRQNISGPRRFAALECRARSAPWPPVSAPATPAPARRGRGPARPAPRGKRAVGRAGYRRRQSLPLPADFSPVR